MEYQRRVQKLRSPKEEVQSTPLCFRSSRLEYRFVFLPPPLRTFSNILENGSVQTTSQRNVAIKSMLIESNRLSVKYDGKSPKERRGMG